MASRRVAESAWKDFRAEEEVELNVPHLAKPGDMVPYAKYPWTPEVYIARVVSLTAPRKAIVVLHHEEEAPRFLGRRGGYVDNPSKGMQAEPEALSSDLVDHYTYLAHRGLRSARELLRDVQKAKTPWNRLADYEAEARHRRVNIRNEARMVKRILRQGKNAERWLERIATKLNADLEARDVA